MLVHGHEQGFCRKVIGFEDGINGIPDCILIDKVGANLAGLEAVDANLKFTGSEKTVKILQVRYLNTILEQPSCDLQATLAGKQIIAS